MVFVSGILKEAYRRYVFGNGLCTVGPEVAGLDKGTFRMEEELVRYPRNMALIKFTIVTIIPHILSASFCVVSTHQSSRIAPITAHLPRSASQHHS